MRVCFVGVAEFREVCSDLLNELVPNRFELRSSSHQTRLPEADVYIWDVDAGTFSQPLLPEILARSLFVIDPKLVDRLRAHLGTAHASILLKPVRAAALRPFLEHAVRQNNPRPASVKPRTTATRAELDDLVDCLLHTNLKLQEYDQFRTNFLARAVHDFRAPLTSLGGYCGLLLEQRLGPLNGSQLDLLARMHHSVMRLSRLADAMFDLSVGRNVKREMNLQKGDVEAVIGQAVHELSQHAEEKQIRITVRVETPQQQLSFDGEKIEQVLVNLLENACKFTPKRGAIQVSAYPVCWNNRSARPSKAVGTRRNGTSRASTANAYRIDVRDSGSGIPLEHLNSIFEEYTSYAGGADRSGGGLGLAICRMIVDGHRGNIWAESGPEGTQFSFILPQHEAKDSRHGAEKSTILAARALSA
jgi:signal transduction histidine kinase